MNLTEQQEKLLEAVRTGVSETVAFMGELTDYHGDAVTTEYIMTVDIAKALMRFTYEDVAVEYLIKRMEHFVFRNDQVPYALGSRRFDIAVLDALIPTFVVEVKIGVVGLKGKLEEDLEKIKLYILSLQLAYARKVLGVCVFQTHYRAREPRSLVTTQTRIREIEDNIRDGLKNFEILNSDFEFDWREFQKPNERIHDDEETWDTDETLMLGRLGHATRYHAIVFRLRS